MSIKIRWTDPLSGQRLLWATISGKPTQEVIDQVLSDSRQQVLKTHGKEAAESVEAEK